MQLDKYKYIYLFVLIIIATAILVLKGPLYEVVIDISVSPPEKIRKTDFSWITVNEWFTSQTYIITSYAILKNIVSDIEIDDMKRIVRAKRLGAADIIRIHARSEEKPEKLMKLVDDIAALYLKTLNDELSKPVMEPEIDKTEKQVYDPELYKNLMDSLYSERAKIQRNIQTSSERLRYYVPELKKIEEQAAGLRNSHNRAVELDREISVLTQNLEKIRMVYTDNWPAAAELKQKIQVLTKEKEALAPEISLLQEVEGARELLIAKIKEDDKTLSDLKDALGSVDERLNQMIMAHQSAQKTDEAVSAKAEVAVPSTKTEGYGYILNPPVVNYLPDLGLQLIYGVTAGVLTWFLLVVAIFRTRVT